MTHPAFNDTICAIATPSGLGAIAVVRLSGSQAITICSNLFFSSKNKILSDQKSHTIHFGIIRDNDKDIDEVLVSIFKAPHSYTGENTIEISCHGSTYIQEKLVNLFLKSGARLANPGEFTMRAFLNGKLDLSQAEAVADLISSEAEAAHQIAIHQMRGGFSKQIKELRQQLVDFASLIELELDFAEEDVEFADRGHLIALVKNIREVIKKLLSSFKAGNVIKSGVPVAIVGEPNVGKSTLLNALLNEERAIVSEIAGTTRDTIEEEISIGGIRFRFIDTAGIRETKDTIETIGINKTFEKINQASVVIYLFDVKEPEEKVMRIIEELKEKINTAQKHILPVANKIDNEDLEKLRDKFKNLEDVLFISALSKSNLNVLSDKLLSFINTGELNTGEPIITNARHYEALDQANQSLEQVLEGIKNNISSDFLAIDIRKALYHLGEITGEVTSDELLGNIFSRFCIGK